MQNWRRMFVLVAPLSRMSIVKKLIVGYFIIIFIPVILFGFYNYNQMYDTMITDYAHGKQQNIEQSYSTLKMDLLQLESKYELFQYNKNVIKYLEGQFQTDLDYAYFYLMQIKPLLSYAQYGNPYIQDIRLFTIDESVFKVPDKIVGWSHMTFEHQSDIIDLLPGKGIWVYDLSDLYEWSVIYYQNLYAQQFSKKVGVLEIQVNDQLLENFIKTLSNEGRSEVYLLPDHMESQELLAADEWIYRTLENPNGFFFLENKRLIVNHLFIEEMGVTVAVVSQAEDVFMNKKERERVLILTFVGLLVILSIIYYTLASSVTKRILRLARHMRNVGENNFRIISERQDQDEIGYLTSTYNLMLQRIDELVNKVQRAELLRKEAAYKVLQAQVKPHFLYNTLETIRMLAEKNEDHEVAEMTFSFGQLMRYSQSDRDEVKLSDEIKNINHYMKVQKMRLGTRLEYSFHIKSNTNRIPCPQFILQPLVENCIVHGVPTFRKGLRIHINIYERDEHVIVEISDNGEGISEERLRTIRKVLDNVISIKNFSTGDRGQGLYNVSERIKAFYGEDSGLLIESKEGVGTTFTLNLNKKGMFNYVEVVSSR